MITPEVKRARLITPSQPMPKVAVLPWGALEPHNYHLPYGTDTFESEFIAVSSAELAAKQGTPCCVLPAIPYGVNGAQLGFPLTISIQPTTQLALLTDISKSLLAHKIYKLVIINGHGGNEFKALVRELQVTLPEIFIAVIDWWKLPPVNELFTNPGDHAGELETSVMMAIQPELVAPLSEAGEGKQATAIIPAMRQGWMWAPRIWHNVTKDSGIGNPSAASPEAGRQLLNQILPLIASALSSLATTDISELYQL